MGRLMGGGRREAPPPLSSLLVSYTEDDPPPLDDIVCKIPYRATRTEMAPLRSSQTRTAVAAEYRWSGFDETSDQCMMIPRDAFWIVKVTRLDRIR